MKEGSMSFKTLIYETGDNDFGLQLYINHSHEQIDVKIYDTEPDCVGQSLASLTIEDIKDIIHKLSNYVYEKERG